MSIVFTLLLLASVVGIIKPYVRGMTRGRFALAAIACFVGVGVTAPKNEKATEVAQVDQNGPSPKMAPEAESLPDQADKPESKWSYSEEKDAMRNTTSHFANIKSNNEVDMDFPYGETAGNIGIRSNNAGLNVYFSVDKGQVLCNSFSNTTISVKFDNGPVQKMGCVGSSDGSSDTAFFSNESRMLAGLRKAKRTIVEAEFFQKGNQQFVFDTAGLVWK